MFCKAVSYLEVECPGSCADVSGPEPCLLGANCALLWQFYLGALSTLHSTWPPVLSEGAVPGMCTGPSYCYPSGWFLSQPRVVSFHAHDQCSAEYLNTQRTLWSPLKVSLGSSLLSWNLSSFVSLASPFWLLSSGYQPPCGLPCSRCSLSLSAGAVVGLTSLAPFLSGIAVLCCIVASLLKTIVSYFACFGVLLDEGGLTIAASILCDRHCRNTLKYCRNTLVNHHTK